VSARSFQDEIGPANGCWGCGPGNAHGLRIRSEWTGEESLCRFTPSPWHAAGPPDVVNGGILATLIDCHGICTAVAAIYREEGRAIGSEPHVWCVTGTLEVTYLRPTPMAALEVRARIEERKGKKTVLACSVTSGSQETARGRVVAIRVPPEWLAGRAPERS
jgi:acyl-coenzyme A thioesterase PaaI-like protein